MISELNEELSNTLEKHRVEIEELSNKHTVVLTEYAKNVGIAEAERNGLLQKEIDRLNQTITSMRQDKITLGDRISNLLSNFKSKSASEEKLQASYDRLFRENQENHKVMSELRTEIADISSLLTRTVQAIGATDKYFWNPYGYLEERRACFRSFYRNLFSDESVKKLATNKGIPRDMVSARYTISHDPHRRLRVCDRYYGS